MKKIIQLIILVPLILVCSQIAVAQKSKSKDSQVYASENPKYIQELIIKSKSKQTVEFIFKITRKKDMIVFAISGKAETIGSGLGAEIDEDEEGNAYSCTEYWYKIKNCEFAIRISDEEPIRIQIKDGSCLLNKDSYPLDTISILRKRN